MAFDLVQVQQIFPVPLITFAVTDAAALNARLVDEIAARRAAEPGLARSNHLGWHSAPDLFDRREPATRELARQLGAMMIAATHRVAPQQDISPLALHADGWINVNPPGAYNDPHSHVGSFWSGCYYVAMPDDPDESSGAIEFIDAGTRLASNLIKAPLTADKVRVQPKVGSVLLFPSTIKHWVHPNRGNADRVTIAFNGWFKPKQPLQWGAAQ